MKEASSRAIILSVLFVLLFMGAATWLSFFNIYLKSQGFSGVQIGLISGIHQLMLMIVVPGWGFLADKFGTIRMFLAGLAVSILLILGLGQIHQFFWYILFIIVFSSFYHSLAPLLDSLAITYVKSYQHISYGELRLWGSLGWAIATPMAGYFIPDNNVGLIFPIAGILFFIIFIIAFITRKKNQYRQVNVSKINWKNLKKIIRQKTVFWFYLLLVIYGITSSPIYLFINLYYEEIGASNFLLGIAFAVQAISEIPFFFYGQKLVDRFGARNIIGFAMLIAIARMTAYGFISNPTIAVFVGFAQGVTLSLFLVGVIDYVQRLVPMEWRATAQSLIWASHFGAGITFGNIWSGYLYDKIHMQGVMKLQAGLTIITLLLLLLYFYKQKHKKNYSASSHTV